MTLHNFRTPSSHLPPTLQDSHRQLSSMIFSVCSVAFSDINNDIMRFELSTAQKHHIIFLKPSFVIEGQTCWMLLIFHQFANTLQKLKDDVMSDEDKIVRVETSLDRCRENLDSSSDKDLPDLIEKTNTLRHDWDALKYSVDTLSISLSDEMERSQKRK